MIFRKFVTPLSLGIIGILIIIAEMAYMWSLRMILLKRGGTSPEWCPVPPDNVPPETGFSYEVSYFPATVDCSVKLKGSELGISTIHNAERMCDHARAGSCPHRRIAGMGTDSRTPHPEVVDPTRRPVSMVTGRRSNYLYVASNTCTPYCEVATRRERRYRVGSSS